MSLLGLACAGAGPGGAPPDGPLADSSRDSSPATPDSDSGCASRAYWPDADGDGFGDASAGSVELCAETAGFVTDATDCDDADAAVNPAATEDCATEADDDCDGSADATDALHCTTWYADEDGDGYGGEAVCACVAPWGDASLTTGGDCDDTDPALNESCTA